MVANFDTQFCSELLFDSTIYILSQNYSLVPIYINLLISRCKEDTSTIRKFLFLYQPQGINLFHKIEEAFPQRSFWCSCHFLNCFQFFNVLLDNLPLCVFHQQLDNPFNLLMSNSLSWILDVVEDVNKQHQIYHVISPKSLALPWQYSLQDCTVCCQLGGLCRVNKEI